MRLLFELLVGWLLPSFYSVWYDLPTNSPTNYPTNNHISWIWMRKKIGLKSIIRKERVGYRHHRFEYQVAIVMLHKGSYLLKVGWTLEPIY